MAFAILFGAVFTAEAQEDIPEIFFKRTIGIVGVPADTLAERMNKWLATNELTASSYRQAKTYSEIFNWPENELTLYCSIYAPNYYRGKEEAILFFKLTTQTSQYRVSLTISEIDCYRNPILGRLYGTNGELFKELYDKRHYRAGMHLIDYLSDLFNEQCSSLEAYLKRP